MAINYPQRYDDDFLNTIKTVIDHVNVHGKTIQDLVAEGQLTPQQYADLITIVNGNIKSGDVDKYDLQKNLRDEIEGKRNKSVPIGLNDLGEKVLAAIEGGDGTEFNILSEPRDGSVSVSKTDFLKPSTNLFNIDHIEKGNISTVTGEEAESEAYSRSIDFIPVKSSQQYTFTGFQRVIQYDHNKKFIIAEQFSDYDTTVDTIQTDANTHFLKVASHSHLFGQAQLNEGDSLLPFEPYYASMEDYIKFRGRNLNDQSVTLDKLDFIERSTNLFDKSKELKDRSITSNGTVNNNDGYNLSDWHRVKPGRNYTTSGFNRIVFFNENKERLSYSDLSTGDTTPSPADAYYCRAHYLKINTDPLQINEGDELLPYEPYYVRFNDEITSTSSSGGAILNIPVFFEVSGLYRTSGNVTRASERDFESTRRTGKHLNVVPGSQMDVTYNKGSLSVFEYDEEFDFIRSTEVENGLTHQVSQVTHYIKLMVGNLDKQDHVNCELRYESPESKAVWVKNARTTAGNINFTYEVFPNAGREIHVTDSVDEQLQSDRYYNAGLLKLPPNYSPTGDPVKLIIFNHGAGDYGTFNALTFGGNYEDYFQYLCDEGFAIMDVYHWTTKYEGARISFGSPITSAAIVQGYKWVKENYNIDDSGVFVSGKSAGGYNGLNILYNKGLNVLAAGLLAPAVSPLWRPFGYNPTERLALADDFGFTGDTEQILGQDIDVLPRTTALKEYMKENADKMVGYNPFWNGIIGVNLETLAEHGAERTEVDTVFYSGVSRVAHVPQKIWVSEDDTAIPVDVIKNYIQTIKNGHGIGELRLLPNGTGGHYAVDSHEDALRVDITTKLGVHHTGVPLAYAEMVQFFRRFES